MKTLAALLFLSLLAPAAAQQPFTLETLEELTSTGDFNGDARTDLAIVDRGTGAYRILSQAADGAFTVSDSRPTSVPQPTALGVGRLLSGPTGARQGLAVTAPEWNQVNLIDPTLDAPIAAARGGLGPASLAVLDVLVPGSADNLDDLMVTSTLDAPPSPHGLSLIQRFPVNSLFVSLAPGDAPLTCGRRVLLKTGVRAFGGFVAATADGSEFRPYRSQLSVLSPITTATGLPADADYTYGFFKNGSPLSQFLFYVRGSSEAAFRPVAEPSPGVYSMDGGTTFDFGAPIHLVSTVEHPGGAWLLVLFNGGADAALYDFDGENPPVERQSFTAPPGQAFTAGAALGGGHFLLTTGVGGRSSGWQRHTFDGTSHTLAASGNWQPAHALSASATVFFFTAEPFVNSGATLTTRMKVGDWTTFAGSGGANRPVGGLRFGGSSAGLGMAFDTFVKPVGHNDFAVPSQYQPAISIGTLSSLAGTPRATVRFSPEPGNYTMSALDATGKFPVKLLADGPSAISYRTFAGAPWELYTKPVELTGDAVFEAYSADATSGVTSPISRAAYRFAAQPALAPRPDADANADGLGDAWAKAFGVKDPGSDPDGDGSSNGEEYLAGTDPRDSASVPVHSGNLVLFIRREGNEAVVFWPAAITGETLQSSPDLAAWAPVTTGIAVAGAFHERRFPLAGKMFFRLVR